MGEAVTGEHEDVTAEPEHVTSRRGPDAERQPPRPLVERLGLGFVALVAAALFGAMSAAAWAGGELFLAIMAGIGLLMTLWAAAATIFRA